MKKYLKYLFLGGCFIFSCSYILFHPSGSAEALSRGEYITSYFNSSVNVGIAADRIRPNSYCSNFPYGCTYFGISGLTIKSGDQIPISSSYNEVRLVDVPDEAVGIPNIIALYGAGTNYVWRCMAAGISPYAGPASVASAQVVTEPDGNGSALVAVVIAVPGGYQPIQGYIRVYEKLYDANFESETSVSYNDEDHGTSGRDLILEAGEYITNPKEGGRDYSHYKIDYIHRLFRVGPNMDKRAENNWAAGRTNGEPDQPSWQTGTQRAGFEVGGQNPQEHGNVTPLEGDVDVGRTERICHNIAHDRNVRMRQNGSYFNGWEWRASGACVNVTHLANFELTDDVQFNDDGVIYAGQTAELTADFYNKTAPNPDIVHTSSPEDTRYRQIWFYTDEIRDKHLEGGITDSDDVSTLCAHFGAAGCQQSEIQGLEDSQKDGRSIAPGETPKVQPIHFNVDDIDVDTTLNNKVCMAVAVSPYRSEDNGYGVKNQWIISNATCRTIAKKPSIAIQAGNFYAQGAITGATSLKNIDNQKMLFGSWAEYLTLSQKPITEFASGAKFVAEKNPGGEANICQYAPLSIASSQCANGQAEAKNVGEAKISSSSQFLNNIMSLYKQDKPAGDETIEDVSVKKGQKQIIFVNGDAHIRNNITVGDADIRYYEQPSDVPQVVILARNIEIDPGVTQLDAWLVAYGEQQDGEYKGGKIDTCSGFRLGDGIGPCNTRLIINGPVVAGEFTPWRSGGAKPGLEGSRETAETITLTPAAYEWGYHEASGGDEAQAHTVYSREVAPRL